ncbi:MAG: DUF2141 domain-containing protein [Thermonemataceae bacterium]
MAILAALFFLNFVSNKIQIKMRKSIISLCVALISVSLSYAQTTANGTIELQIDGVEKTEGHLIISLYKESTGFPTKPELAFKQYKMPVESLNPRPLSLNLPFGSYAIAVYHDENGDGKFNTNFIGIPKEKTGASNNPKALFIPSFNQAKFDLSKETINLTIQIK